MFFWPNFRPSVLTRLIQAEFLPFSTPPQQRALETAVFLVNSLSSYHSISQHCSQLAVCRTPYCHLNPTAVYIELFLLSARRCRHRHGVWMIEAHDLLVWENMYNALCRCSVRSRSCRQKLSGLPSLRHLEVLWSSRHSHEQLRWMALVVATQVCENRWISSSIRCVAMNAGPSSTCGELWRLRLMSSARWSCG